MRPIPALAPAGATLGILGAALRPDCPPRLRATRLDRFQQLAGELAAAPGPSTFLAGHAAAHALLARLAAVELARVDEAPSLVDSARSLVSMGPSSLVDPDLAALRRADTSSLRDLDLAALRRAGTSSLVDPDLAAGTSSLVDPDLASLRRAGTSSLVDPELASLRRAGTSSLRDPAPWLEALGRLLEGVAPSIVIAPGLVACEVLVALAAALERRGATDTVFLYDLPADTTLAAALDTARVLEAAAPGLPVRGVLPWVSSLTPGRSGLERLAPSCIAPALLVGATRRLSGQHELDAPPWLDAAATEALHEAGVAVLVAEGRRRQVALFEPPRPKALAVGQVPPDVVSRLRLDLDHALAELAAMQPSGERPREIWARAARQATTVLREYERRGLILGFTVRCDEDTNEGAPLERPVVDVTIQPRARAVREFALRVGQAGEPRKP